MRLVANQRHWWARGAGVDGHTLEGRWLPLLGLGGLVMALILPAWQTAPQAEENPHIAATATDIGSADFHQLPAIQIRLRADAAGHLASIVFNGQRAKDLSDLRAQIEKFVGPDATVEAELDCDGALRYEQTQQIVSGISMRAAADGRSIAPLVDRIKFAARRSDKQ